MEYILFSQCIFCVLINCTRFNDVFALKQLLLTDSVCNKIMNTYFYSNFIQSNNTLIIFTSRVKIISSAFSFTS